LSLDFRLSNLAQMEKHTCPRCGFSDMQMKAGRNRTGSQRFLCRACGRSYTPEPKPAGHGDSKRAAALRCYAAGLSVRASARCSGVNHQTVVNWVRAAVAEAEREREGGTLEPGSLLSHVALRRSMELQRREREGAAAGIGRLAACVRARSDKLPGVLS
jgi:transposase-like protein